MILHRLRRATRLGLHRFRRRGDGEHRPLFALAGGSGDRPEMGRALYRASAPVRQSIGEAGAVVEAVLGWPVADGFRGVDAPAATPEIARRNEIVRLGLMQLAQVDLWRAEGVSPGGVAALSLGEMVAPYAAGVLSRADAARVIAVVAQAISLERTPQRMFHLRADAATAQRLCLEAPGSLTYLGSTGPGVSMVLSDESAAPSLREYLRAWIEREVPSDWRYHTPRLRVDDGWMTEMLRDLTFHPARCPIYSAAAGDVLPPDAPFDASFFRWMVSRPFRFDRAVAAALDDGFDLVVNLGTGSATRAPVAEAARVRGREVLQVETIRPDDEAEAGRAARAALRPLRLSAAPSRAPADPHSLDLASRAFTTDPFRAYEELRQGGSVHHLDRHDCWIALGFEEVRRALREPQSFSSRVPGIEKVDGVLLGSDPPEHTAVRRLLARHFTAAELERRAEGVRSRAEGLLQPLLEGRTLDVVGGLADPISCWAGADVLGVEVRDAASLAEQTLRAGGSTASMYEALRAPIDALAPRAALYRTMLEEGGGLLDDAALRSLVGLVWIAGTSESRRLLPQAVLLLLELPGVRASVQADPSLLEPFVEEVLRLRPPEHFTVRVTTRDVELGGIRLPAGARVRLCLAAANRDPSRFESPEAARLDRAAGQHLSFGGGSHYCIGAPLARMQTRVVLGALLRLAPRFRAVQPPSTVRYVPRAPGSQIEQLVIGP